MKRVFTLLLASFLSVSTVACGFSQDVNTTNAKESTTEVNLIDTEATTAAEITTEAATTDTTDTTDTNPGGSYDLEGITNSPDITAESALVMDARSGEVLYAKQSRETRYPASITKVMTTLLAIENCNMDDIVTFTSEAVNSIEPGSSSAGIPAGAQLTVEETLYALMLVSANEAGAAIAEHVAGSNDAFAKLMTDRAKEIGCTGTQFKNPHGLPDEEHYTTAYDMGLIMQECIRHEEFRKIAGTISYTITKRDSLPNDIELWNHAKILRESTEYYYVRAKGAKTGFTQAALNTLVTYAEKDGTQLICIILRDHGADNSYYDTRNLYRWAFEQVKTVKPLKNFDLSAAYATIPDVTEDEISTYKSLNASYQTDYPILVKKNFDSKNLVSTFHLKEDKENGVLGYIEVKGGDTVVYKTDVTYDTTTEAAKTYLSGKAVSDSDDDNDENNDDLKTAKVDNNNSLLKKLTNYLIRGVIACVLIYVIMQLIHRRQAEKARQERMRKRKRPGQTSNTVKKRSSTTKKGSQIKRNRRHK